MSPAECKPFRCGHMGHRWLIQLMVCNLFHTKPLSEPTLTYFQWGFRANFREIWIKQNIFFQENGFENVVCREVAIFYSVCKHDDWDARNQLLTTKLTLGGQLLSADVTLF